MLPMTILLKPGCSILNKKSNFHLFVSGNSFNLFIQKRDEILKNFPNFSRHDILADFDINTTSECLSIWGVLFRTRKIFFLCYI